VTGILDGGGVRAVSMAASGWRRDSMRRRRPLAGSVDRRRTIGALRARPGGIAQANEEQGDPRDADLA
jgi:hypothetical protein